MIYIANYGTGLSTSAVNAINSFVALGTTPGGSALTKDAGGNFVNTAISGGGTPGGSNTQLQYNNSSAFGGIVRATTDGTTVSFLANGILIKDQTDATKIAAWDASAISTGTTRTYTLPNITGTIALTTGSQTLQSKTLDNTNTITVKDNSFTLQDDGDTTKQVVFQLSGITTGNTRTLTVQDLAGTIALLGNNLGSFASTTSAQLATVISDETGSGALVFGTSPALTTPKITTAIQDVNGNNIIAFTATGTAVDYLRVTNSATGTPGVVILSADGTDSNVQLTISPKGTGRVRLTDGTDTTKALSFNISGSTTGINTTFAISSTSLRTITFPDASDTLVGKATTDTLTNKRITKRVVTVNAPGATPTTNTDNCDIAKFTGLNTAITSMTTNLSGTPNDGDMVMFQFLDDGTARGITWGATFASTTVTLPTTTVISTMLRVLCQWSSNNSKWNCIATA